MSRADELAAKEASRQALEAANAKLEALNEVGKAPTSWADLGLPSKPPEPPAVPAFVSAAPLVLGGFSVLLFALNAVGLFGDGPDLDKLVDEWAQLEMPPRARPRIAVRRDAAFVLERLFLLNFSARREMCMPRRTAGTMSVRLENILLVVELRFSHL